MPWLIPIDPALNPPLPIPQHMARTNWRALTSRRSAPTVPRTSTSAWRPTATAARCTGKPNPGPRPLVRSSSWDSWPPPHRSPKPNTYKPILAPSCIGIERCDSAGEDGTWRLAPIRCAGGLAFDVLRQLCDWKSNVKSCDVLESKWRHPVQSAADASGSRYFREPRS